MYRSRFSSRFRLSHPDPRGRDAQHLETATGPSRAFLHFAMPFIYFGADDAGRLSSLVGIVVPVPMAPLAASISRSASGFFSIVSPSSPLFANVTFRLAGDLPAVSLPIRISVHFQDPHLVSAADLEPLFAEVGPLFTHVLFVFHSCGNSGSFAIQLPSATFSDS